MHSLCTVFLWAKVAVNHHVLSSLCGQDSQSETPANIQGGALVGIQAFHQEEKASSDQDQKGTSGVLGTWLNGKVLIYHISPRTVLESPARVNSQAQHPAHIIPELGKQTQGDPWGHWPASVVKSANSGVSETCPPPKQGGSHV